ncbi:polyketide synthase [Stemphylium lycopersici]|nr:polyketide synthase [Stemphylium lycopersici]
MNGAMVMRDRMFADQPWAEFSAVMAPKVAGTQNLVALLDQEAKPGQLDFVMFFSSAVAVAGNAGQTAYGASNWFMQGTASQLRRRGTPACVVHIGHVSGLGYVHRHENRKKIEEALHVLMAPVSEIDLLDTLAEAIVGGRPNGKNPPEIIIGVRGDIRAYTWREQPRLWHYLQSDEDGSDASNQNGGNISLKAQLAAAAGDQDVCLELLLTSFGSALCAMLHMKPEELDSNMPVASLGIDSLVAVRIREWVMHYVGVEVSVLKVMSANTALVELCKDILAVWRKQRCEQINAKRSKKEIYKNMPAAEPKATSPNTTNPALVDPTCTPPTVLAAPVKAEPVGSAPALPLALSVCVCVCVCVSPLLLASGSCPLSSSGGLHTTTSTRSLRQRPSSKKLCAPSAQHTAVHGRGEPIALILPLSQQAYRSQKAWSLMPASLLIVQPPARLDEGRASGALEGEAEAEAVDSARQDSALPQRKIEGMSVGVVNGDGDGLVKVV